MKLQIKTYQHVKVERTIKDIELPNGTKYYYDNENSNRRTYYSVTISDNSLKLTILKHDSGSYYCEVHNLIGDDIEKIYSEPKRTALYEFVQQYIDNSLNECISTGFDKLLFYFINQVQF
jgi:hypothetical protein